MASLSASEIQEHTDIYTGRVTIPKLTITKQGFKVWLLKFPAALPPTLCKAYYSGMETMGKTRSKETLEHFRQIYRFVINAFPDNDPVSDDFLLQMSQHVTNENGIHAIQWLKDRLCPDSAVETVKLLTDVVTLEITDSNVIPAMNTAITNNLRLDSDFQLPDLALSVILLTKLPDFLSTLKDSIIQDDGFPSPRELVRKVSKALSFRAVPSAVNMVVQPQRSRTAKLCFNCDSDEHWTSDCTRPAAGCRICGPNTRHMNKHCLSQNGRPIPASVSDKSRAVIMANRKRDGIVTDDTMCLACVDDEFPDDWLAKLEKPDGTEIAVFK